MIKLLPSFSYSFLLESEDYKKNLGILKERFLANGADLKVNNEDELVLEISAGKLATAVTLIPDTLRIHIRRRYHSNTLKIEVIRISEKKASIAFVCLASIICIAAFIQQHDPKALMMPFIIYGFMWPYSFMAIHPAHKTIRKLVRFSDEP